VRARLIEFLLSRPQPPGAHTISLGMTQQALAEDLGSVREVVARELRALVKLRLVEPAGGGRYRLPDREALRRMVESPG